MQGNVGMAPWLSFGYIFIDIMGIIHKEFVLVSQTVNSAYYCDIL
jgi:hypothetical protein